MPEARRGAGFELDSASTVRYGALEALLSPVVGQDLHEVGNRKKALSD